MPRTLAVSVIVLTLAVACTGPSTSSVPLIPSPAGPSSIDLSPGHQHSVGLPDPYRLSDRLSLDFPVGGRPAWQDVFTARTTSDETAAACAGATSCPTWSCVAIIQAYSDVAADTPRIFYTRSGGAIGESIVDRTVDGRSAFKVMNGAGYPKELGHVTRAPCVA
jgi:hypothetical protein